MKSAARIKCFCESAIALAAYGIIPFLPRRAVLGLARVMGDMAWRMRRRWRRVAMANLDLAYGNTLSPDEKEELIRETSRNCALTVVDFLWFARFTGPRIRAFVKFDASFDHYLRSKPVIAVTAHLGNWEAMGMAAALHGAPTVSVAASLDGGFVESLVNGVRQKTGQQIIPQEGAIRSLMRILKDGGRTAVLVDQNTRPDEGGVFVNLFGVPVPMTKTVAALAGRTGSAIVFTYCISDGHGGYVAFAEPPLPVAGLTEEQVTQAIANLLEQVVRKHPAHWLWFYMRWKFIPAGVPADRYPFYARRMKGDKTEEEA